MTGEPVQGSRSKVEASLFFCTPVRRRLFVTFLACPRKVTQRRAPRRPFWSVMLGRSRYISETRPPGSDIRNASPSDSVACRECSHGAAWESDCLRLYPYPACPRTSLFKGCRALGTADPESLSLPYPNPGHPGCDDCAFSMPVGGTKNHRRLSAARPQGKRCRGPAHHDGQAGPPLHA
jgi:hypothetical protein